MSADDPDVSRSDRLTATWIELSVRLGVLGFLLYWAFILVRPFITIAIWSVVLTVALDPVYRWLVARLGGRRRLAAVLLTLLSLLFVIGPATWLAAIGIEASGGYERGVIRALLAEGISVRQINPFKLRQFAKASGVLAKIYRLDARMIALFVATMPTRPAQRNQAAERVGDVVTARRQLSDQKVAAENASRLFEDASLRRLYRRRVARLALDNIALLDKRLAEMVSADVVLGETLSPPDLHAGRRSGPRFHADRIPAGTRPNEPQAGRCYRRRRAI